MVNYSAESTFFQQNERVNSASFVEKARAFVTDLDQMSEYFNAKKICTEQDENIKRALAFFEKNYYRILATGSADNEELPPIVNFIDEELAKERSEQDFGFKQELLFLLHNERHKKSFNAGQIWLDLLFTFYREKLREEMGKG